MIDEELTSPEAFASQCAPAPATSPATQTEYGVDVLRPYAQLTLLMGIELEDACAQLTSKGLRYAYRWAVAGGGPVHSA